ncbi:MAG: type 4a pilus biogenesis protein PilO [Desulfuromonadaceae bacterium]|nr:type 4a pilus biogenesis protein PilO [Desulfuromonadaceae bacterium]MDD2854512.1 type 4a pilus biogenesis protein PilO [Desulfuromonadaceae bacterium]
MKQYLLEILLQKRRLLGVLISLIVLNIALLVFQSLYQMPALAELQTKWSDVRRTAAVAGKQDAAALHKKASEDLLRLQSAIPERREFAGVLSKLYESASENAVQVGTFSYKPVQIKNKPLLSYELSVAVSGSYAAVKSYLSDLQSSPELMVVDSVSFSNSDVYTENVVMNLKITVYLRGAYES